MSLKLEKSSSSFSPDQDNQIHSDFKMWGNSGQKKETKIKIDFFLPIRQYDDKSEGLRLDQNISTLVATHI